MAGWWHYIKALGKDLLPMGRNHYFLLAGPDHLSLFSIGRKGKIQVYGQGEVSGGFDRTLDRFVTRLREDGSYFGQDITLLIAEPAAYTITKPRGKQSLADLQEECRKILLGPIEREFRSVILGGNKYFVIYGLDTDFVSLVTTSLQKNNIPVGRLMPLSGLVINQVLNKTTLPNKEVELPIGEYRCLLDCDRDKPFYCEPNEDTYLALASLRSDRAFDSLASLCPAYGQGNPFLAGKIIPKTTKYILIGAGSARLLISLISLLAVLFLSMAGIFALMRSSAQEKYDRFQDSLAEMAMLESQIHAVDKELKDCRADQIHLGDFGAHLSLFCQRVPAGLHLTELKAEKNAEGITSVIAQGKTRRETAVFQYRDFIHTMAGGKAVEINALSRLNSPYDIPDSLWYRFTITMK